MCNLNFYLQNIFASWGRLDAPLSRSPTTQGHLVSGVALVAASKSAAKSGLREPEAQDLCPLYIHGGLSFELKCLTFWGSSFGLHVGMASTFLQCFTCP